MERNIQGQTIIPMEKVIEKLKNRIAEQQLEITKLEVYSEMLNMEKEELERRINQLNIENSKLIQEAKINQELNNLKDKKIVDIGKASKEEDEE